MASAHTSLKPIDANVVRGRKPLTASQFREIDSDAHTNHGTAVEKCLAIINGKLLARFFYADRSFSILDIGPIDRHVVEEALAIMRDKGGWLSADILSQSVQGYSLQFHP